MPYAKKSDAPSEDNPPSLGERRVVGGWNCPECFAGNDENATICKNCGWELDAVSDAEIHSQYGDVVGYLVELASVSDTESDEKLPATMNRGGKFTIKWKAEEDLRDWKLVLGDMSK